MIVTPRPLLDGHKDGLEIVELVIVDIGDGVPLDFQPFSCQVTVPMGNDPKTGKPLAAGRRFAFKADSPAHAFEIARSMRDAETLRLRTDIRAKQARQSLVVASAMPNAR